MKKYCNVAGWNGYFLVGNLLNLSAHFENAMHQLSK
jgi:hypothetical protein